MRARRSGRGGGGHPSSPSGHARRSEKRDESRDPVRLRGRKVKLSPCDLESGTFRVAPGLTIRLSADPRAGKSSETISGPHMRESGPWSAVGCESDYERGGRGRRGGSLRLALPGSSDSRRRVACCCREMASARTAPVVVRSSQGSPICQSGPRRIRLRRPRIPRVTTPESPTSFYCSDTQLGTPPDLLCEGI